MLFSKLTLLGLTTVLSIQLQAQSDTIKIAHKDLQMRLLDEASSRYLVYIQKPDQSMMDIAIWERTVGTRIIRGMKHMSVSQSWRNTSSEKERYLLSYCSWGDFTPLYHRTVNGKGELEAYNFDQTSISGADTTKNNQKSGFFQTLSEPTLNWELDMEVFQTLPYRANVVFAINFYHPGSKKGPKDYYYQVAELEELLLSDGSTVMTWPMTIDYGEGNAATFWIEDKSRNVLRMEEKFGDIKRYKIKLSHAE